MDSCRFVVELKLDGSWIVDDVVDIHRDSGELNLDGWIHVFSLFGKGLVPRSVEEKRCVDIPWTKSYAPPTLGGTIHDIPVSIVQCHILEHYNGCERRVEEECPENIQNG